MNSAEPFKFVLPLSPTVSLPVTRTYTVSSDTLPEAKEIKSHPSSSPPETANAFIYFVGTATTIIEWNGVRLMTDPNFLHDGDHVHLGPGVTATRKTNPAVDLEKLPSVDVVLLSHYHALGPLLYGHGHRTYH
jgi:hypothetical protein